MAFIHDNYSTILKNNLDEVTYNLFGGHVPLANSNIRIIIAALSKVQNLQYNFLDAVSLQCCPSTSTDEYLDNWAALKGITRKAVRNTACSQIRFLCIGVPLLRSRYQRGIQDLA